MVVGFREARTLEERVRGRYDELPASERALADLILEFPGDLLAYSATELAERGKVSKAAVTRFVQRLGYNDYREMRREVREAQDAGEPVYLNTGLRGASARRTKLEHHVARDIENIRRSAREWNQGDLDAVVDRCLTARRLWIVGFRNSYHFASYIRRQLIQVRSDVVLLPTAGQTLIEEIATATPADMMIAIGLRRRPPHLRKIMSIMSEMNVPIAYVTDKFTVKNQDTANWTFQCHVRGVSLFDSYSSVMTLLNYVCTETVSMAGEKGREQINRIEMLLRTTEEIEASR